MIYLIATLTIKPGSMPAIMEGVMPCIEATRKETGCISYDLFQSTTDENTLVFVERWIDQPAVRAGRREGFGRGPQKRLRAPRALRAEWAS